jgi:hypothetical protein
LAFAQGEQEDGADVTMGVRKSVGGQDDGSSWQAMTVAALAEITAPTL